MEFHTIFSRRCFGICTVFVLVYCYYPTLRACDTWVAMPDATADGSVILAKNSDRPPMEAQVLVHFTGKKHVASEKTKCTYIEIPQSSQTYEHIGSKIWWAFGYEHGMNEHGVAIGK